MPFSKSENLKTRRKTVRSVTSATMSENLLAKSQRLVEEANQYEASGDLNKALKVTADGLARLNGALLDDTLFSSPQEKEKWTSNRESLIRKVQALAADGAVMPRGTTVDGEGLKHHKEQKPPQQTESSAHQFLFVRAFAFAAAAFLTWYYYGQ